MAYQSEPDNKYIFWKAETPSENKFNFISFSWNTEEKSANYYINWVLVAVKIYPEDWILDGQYFRFFWFPDWFANLKWQLDEIRLYNKVLSASEISNLFNNYTK